MEAPIAIFSPHATVGEATEHVRTIAGERLFTYAYVVDAASRLLGVVTMRDLLLPPRSDACGNTTTSVGGTNSSSSSSSSSTLTTSTSSSTSLPGGGSTSTTSSSSTTIPSFDCSITSATCTESACTCASLAGLDYHLGATGTAHGPVGTQVRVNTQLMQGGVIDCGQWTKIGSAVNVACDTIGCCERQDGQPESMVWTVFESYDFGCFCPDFPGISANFDMICQYLALPVVEHERTTSPCP